MVPARSDVRWESFLNRMNSLPVSGLSTRMLLSRLKIKIIFDDSPGTRRQVIDEAFEFFSMNQEMVRDDIKLIFGSGPDAAKGRAV